MGLLYDIVKRMPHNSMHTWDKFPFLCSSIKVCNDSSVDAASIESGIWVAMNCRDICLANPFLLRN